MAGGKSQRRVATVVFVDVVNSTRVASEVGDARWRELVGAFRATVRRQLKRLNGHEVDTAGDGFFAWFDSPARALQAAAAVTAELQALGLVVRCGLHTGELEQIDGRLGGIGAHIGARVMAAAGPAEILATSTVRELVTGGAATFDPFAEVELKGVPGRWALHRLTSVEGQPVVKPLDAGEAANRRSATAPAFAGRQPLVWAGFGLIALAVIVGAGWTTGLFGTSPTPPPRLSPTAVGQPSLTPTQQPTATASLKPSPTPPVAMVGVDPFVNDAKTVIRGDTKPGISELFTTDGKLWQSYIDANFLVRRDLETGSFLDSFQLPPDAWFARPGFGSIWVARGQAPAAGVIDRMDGVTWRVIDTIDPHSPVLDIVVGDRAVYLLEPAGQLSDVDPLSNKVVASYPVGTETAPNYIDAYKDGLLFLAEPSGRISAFDPTTRKIVRLEGPEGDLDFPADPSTGTIWVSDLDARALVPVDVNTGARGPAVQLAGVPYQVAYGWSSIWVAAGPFVYRIGSSDHQIQATVSMPFRGYARSIVI